MSVRVKPSPEYRDQFPRARWKFGDLTNEDGDFVTVQWDGAGVPEKLHRDYVTIISTNGSALMPKRGQATQRREAILAWRKSIRAAFDQIRHDSQHRDLVNKLARVLGGKEELSEKTIGELAVLGITLGSRP